MRKSSNVRSAIVAPEFTNVKLYNDGYKVTISLPISGDVYQRIYSTISADIVICYRGKYYIHYETSYRYETPFAKAFDEAYGTLKHMKITIRQAKIDILYNEITMIENS